MIVPMFYVWFDDLNLWRRRVFGRSGNSVAVAPPPAGLPDPGPAR
jgi:hypothetical protein